jgi:hypothetical protein
MWVMGPLRGRADEQSALHDELERALAGSAGLVLLSGEPGIGKTVLLEDLATRMRTRNGSVGWGTCWDGDGAPAFWPWQRALPVFDDLQATVPTDDPNHFALFTAVADQLRTEAVPTLLVLDDLQWADADCLRLLRFLARDLRDCPVLLAGGFRDVDLPLDHSVRALVADSATVRLHLPLEGLPASAIAAVLTDATGTPPPAELVDRVRVRTAGNPFFVREIARLPETELSRRLSGPVLDAVGARVDVLPSSTRRALSAAAVVGRDFEDNLVARAHDVSVDDLAAALAPAVATRLVERAGPGRHRFVHDLVREHLLATLTPAEERARHRAVHDALVTLSDVPMRTARLAGHAVLAVPDLAVDVALQHCEAAADEAERTRMYDEAARHLRAAVGLEGGAEPGRLLRLADDLRRSGHLGEAGARYTALLEVADEPTIRARAALGLHEVGIESVDSRQPLIDALDGALDSLPSESTGLLAEVTAALARELADGPDRDPGRADQLATAAVDLARVSGDEATLAACLFARHDVIWAPGTAPERRDLGAELRRVAARSAPELAFQGALCRYVALVELASPEAEGALVEVEKRAADLGQPVLAYLAATRRDAWDAMTGAPDMEARIAESHALGVRLEVPDAYGVFVTQLVGLDIAAHDGPQRMIARRKLLGGQLMPPDFAVEERAFELAAEDNLAGAATVLADAPLPSARSMFRWRALAAVAFSAEIAWRCRATERARAAYDELAPYAGQLVVIGGAVTIVGPVDAFLGLSADCLGRVDDARGHWEAALRQAQAMSAQPWIQRLTELLAIPTSRLPRFSRQGAVWSLEYAGLAVHVPDSKGVRDLAALLAQPGSPIPALVLASGPEAPAPQFGSDEVIDDTARAAYRRRLQQLDDELDDAAVAGDEHRVLVAQGERDALIDELSRSLGLGGRARRLGDPGERARSTVTARIKDSLTRIEAMHPELGSHLRATVHTGRQCVYEPHRS